jgi:hypothetical protein
MLHNHPRIRQVGPYDRLQNKHIIVIIIIIVTTCFVIAVS